MKNFRIDRETLKIIACVTMLLDHIGAAFVPGMTLRIIGRLAFPIYCFLLAEGIVHTHNRKKYALRLLLVALLAELPFDLLFFGRFTWAHQSVMVTLLLGFCAAWVMMSTQKTWLKAAVGVLAILAAGLFASDYGASGVGMILLFALTRDGTDQKVMQLVGMLILSRAIGGATISICGLHLFVQCFSVLALIPIWLYSGEQKSKSKALQWGFTLFYPVHMLALLSMKALIGS